MLQDLLHVFFRFGRCYRQNFSLLFQIRQNLRDSLVYFIFKNALCLVPLPVFCDGLLCFFAAKACKIHERFQKRRSHVTVQFFQIRLFDAKGCQRILYASCNSRTGIGQGSVQIK